MLRSYTCQFDFEIIEMTSNVSMLMLFEVWMYLRLLKLIE